MILLADPQIVDPHTYPGRPWPLSALTIRHTDQYMRRSFISLQQILDPDTLFFLGDLFDGGREWSTAEDKSPDARWHKYGDEYWLHEYDRFGKLFVRPWLKGNSMQSQQQERKFVASLPGNHDLGLGNGIRFSVRKRFHTFFGHGDRIDVIGNHTLVSLDSVSLSAKSQFETVSGDRNPALWESSEAFLAAFKERSDAVVERAARVAMNLPENALQRHLVSEVGDDLDGNQWHAPRTNISSLPTIILSHLPFYRRPDTPCGPLREKWPPSKSGDVDPHHPNSILVAYGLQYQNVLSEDLSIEVINKIGETAHIFSGDDHDYCEVVHKYLPGHANGIPDITVKSNSWAMGVRKPGFQLVSLWNPLDTLVDSGSKSPTIQTHLCLLPDQLGIFIRYIILIGITFLVLGARALMLSRAKMRHQESLLPPPVSTPTFPPSTMVRHGRSDSASYASSANSNDSHGLAVRSNANRSRPLSPANGYGFDHGFGTPSGSASPVNSGLLSPLPEQAQYARRKGSISKSKGDHHVLHLPGSRRNRFAIPHSAWIRETFLDIAQVGCIALLWYAWLAYTV